MKKIITAFAAMLFIKIIAAQNPNMDYRFAIKVYNLARYEETDKFRPTNPVEYNYYHDRTKSLKLFHPTVAVQWKTKRNNFHEIELTDFEWENSAFTTHANNDSIKTSVLVYEENISRTIFAARYEFQLMFNKKKERKLVPSLGFAASPYYKRLSSLPGISSSFPKSEQTIGLKMFITPRITYFIKQKLFLDFNIPICISQTESVKEKNGDPSLPSAQREIFSLDANTIPQMFSARVGIGIKF